MWHGWNVGQVVGATSSEGLPALKTGRTPPRRSPLDRGHLLRRGPTHGRRPSRSTTARRTSPIGRAVRPRRTRRRRRGKARPLRRPRRPCGGRSITRAASDDGAGGDAGATERRSVRCRGSCLRRPSRPDTVRTTRPNQLNSALQPSRVAEPTTNFGRSKGGNVTSAGWQVTPCNLMWHVSCRSGEAGCVPLYFVQLLG